MQYWNRLTLKSKLFFTFSAILIPIIAIICSIFYYSNVKEMKKQTQSLSSVLSRQFDKTLELHIEDIERLSLAIFTDPIIQSSLDYKLHESVDTLRIKNNIYPRLFNQAYHRPNIESISIYTMDKTVYEYTRRGDIEIEHGIEEHWTEEVNNINKKDFLLLPTTNLETKGNTKEFVVPLVRNIYRIPQRDKIGAMKILINVAGLKDLLKINNNHELEDHMRVFVLNDDGFVIYDNKDSMTGSQHIGFDLSIFSNETNVGNIEWQEKEYIYSFENSNYTNWNTTVLISNEYIMAAQKKILKYILAIGLLSVLLIAILSYFLSHHITKPLRKMMDTMNLVKDGKLNERMELVGNVEVDILSDVYNNMLDSINRLITEVYESKLTENDAKILALQAQINPHFLYNTLNIMKSISRIKGVEEVAEISESLASLFKYSMKHFKHPVPLSNEIDHVQNYMNIQYHRFSNRFIINYDIPSDLQETLIPKLTIQPIVENAFKHGLSDKKEGGVIEVIARKEGEMLVIQIIDNGKGVDPDSLRNILTRLSETNFMDKYEGGERGIGLINIQQRIQLLYGDRHCLKISSVENEGFMVTVEIPYMTHK